MEGEIKRLKRELQCEGAITKYYKDTVLLPNGNTAVWDFVGHNGAAAVVPVLEDGRLLMVTLFAFRSRTVSMHSCIPSAQAIFTSIAF